MLSLRCVALALLVALPASAAHPYSSGAAAAAQPQASAAATEMLEAGGNAFDAVVAAALTMAVVGPYHSGLGGGGFAVMHLAATGEDLAFDFREVAPLAATRDMYLEQGTLVPSKATDGVLSIAVPGAIKGYLELQKKYGRLPRARVFAPAIRAAKQGFLVTPKYADIAAKREACLQSDADASRIFLRPGASSKQPKVPPLGTLLKQPELAQTLTQLATQGEAAFYGGTLGRAVVDSVRKKGGLLSLEDLTRYHTVWRTPLEGEYRGSRFVTMPPPSAGGIAIIQTLGMLEARELKGPSSRDVTALHGFIEALRLAYVERAKWLGDPDVVDVPTARLTSRETIAELASHIDLTHATRSLRLVPEALRTKVPEPPPGAKNTTHVSVIDGEGNAVALTTTVNYYFGSCVVAGATGLLLNDEMDDFAADPGKPNVFGLVTGEANAVAPMKRPLSSMSPTLVFMKNRPHDVMLALGSPGGSTIPTTVMQVMSNVLDGHLDVARAVAQGRLHHQWLPDEVWVEPNALDPATAAALGAMGHTLVSLDAWGDAEAVMVDPVTNLRTAASDPRHEGAPSGVDRR